MTSKVIGCFPLYPPLELLHSMDLQPLVLWGLKSLVDTTTNSDKHLQNFTCSVGRLVLEVIISGGIPGMTGVLSYNAGDTLRNLPEIARRGLAKRGLSLHWSHLHVPMNGLENEVAREYFAKEIHGLVSLLERQYTSSFNFERFKDSVETYREMRALALKMEEMVREGRMSFASQVKVHLDANLLPVEEQIIAFNRAMEHHEREPEMQDNPGVIITGILPPPPAIAATIDAAGFTVVGNDIAALHRAHASMPNGEITSLIDYYIDFYRDHCPCPTLLSASDARIAYLEKMIEETGARGMIFLGEKFCEYEYLELPFIEELVKDRGLSLLRLEFSHDDRDGLAQHVNRIEAFSEVLQKQPEGKMDES